MNTPDSILARKVWNPEAFREALKDLHAVEDNAATPEVEESITKTLKMLAAYLTQLRVLGKVSVLRGYGMMLGELLMRHPKLPRLRQLTFAQRVGVRMELMIEDVLQAEALPSIDKAKAALIGDRFAARRKIIKKLMEADWVPTAALVEASGTTRQNVHQVLLPALTALGLVISREEKGVHLHRCTDLAKRAYKEIGGTNTLWPDVDVTNFRRLMDTAARETHAAQRRATQSLAAAVMAG